MRLPDRNDIEAAARIVSARMSPTPTYAWPLLQERLGAQLAGRVVGVPLCGGNVDHDMFAQVLRVDIDR